MAAVGFNKLTSSAEVALPLEPTECLHRVHTQIEIAARCDICIKQGKSCISCASRDNHIVTKRLISVYRAIKSRGWNQTASLCGERTSVTKGHIVAAGNLHWSSERHRFDNNWNANNMSAITPGQLTTSVRIERGRGADDGNLKRLLLSGVEREEAGETLTVKPADRDQKRCKCPSCQH